MGETYFVKRTGPKTEPWRIPQDEGNMKEEEHKVIEKDRMERWDLSQL